MVKFLVMDVDGTLTDGKIYMGASGEIMKSFNIKDGCGIKDILPKYDIIPIIITARESQILINRCEEICIEKVYQGIRNKIDQLNRIVKNLGECAYIGDDILDIQCMIPIREAGGVIGCPADSVNEVKDIAHFISEKNGGEGAVRDFIEWIIKRND